MQDQTPRANNQLPLTRNHLYALGALALSLAVLAFFVGLSLGRGGGGSVAEPVVMTRLLSDEVRRGELEVLLAQVEESAGAEMTLGFPAELPRTDVAVPPTPPGADGATPEPLPEPSPAPFPAEARPGLASVPPGSEIAPQPAGQVPSGGWSIQVGEHVAEGDAQRAVETLIAAELPAYRVVALVEGEPRWRVRIGGYGTKEAATGDMGAVSSRSGATTAIVTPAP